MADQRLRLNRTVGPTTEPVSLAEARDQCEIAATVTDHDTKLTRYIIASREQVENDTGYALATQTFTLTGDCFPSGAGHIQIPVRPVASITGITYYDTSNAQQTLATSVYDLDQPRRQVHLKYDQEWPSITTQRNGIEVTLRAGYGTAASVPSLFKQAILLQVTKWWVHRGDESKMPAHDSAYESIIARLIRTSYP